MELRRFISGKKTGGLVFLLIFFFLFTGFNREQDPSKSECLDCHDDIKAALKEKYLHYPVEAEQCDACHNEATSGYVEKGSALCTVCHRDYAGEAEGKIVHEAVEDCTNCHNPHASANKLLLIDPVPSLCFSCHDIPYVVGEFASEHAPFEEGECLTCHDSHISSNRALLVEPPHALCSTCHDYEDAGFNKTHYNLLQKDTDCLSCHRGHVSSNAGLIVENSHAPFAEGACDSCHLTASGVGDSGLVARGALLCIPCHSEIDQLLKSKFVHFPAEEDCLNCHGPHGTGEESGLLETGRDLCALCHDDTMIVGEGEEMHQPFSEGECVRCHDPHGSDYQGILSTHEKETCLPCHSQIAETLENTQGHTATLQGCSGCHEAHKGKLRSLLKGEGEGEELCFRCHDSRSQEIFRFVHYPYKEGNCATCHLPHGGIGDAILTKEPEQLCTMCHPERHKEFPHPTGVKPSAESESRPESKLPLSSKGEVVCTTCHVSHSTNTVFLLRSNVIGGELCYECHQR